MTEQDHTISLLIVEDDSSFSRLLVDVLTESPLADFKTFVVRSLEEGMEYIENCYVDAIILDLGLPDSQGLATLKAMYAKASGTPIIVCTGEPDESLSLKAIQAGAADYISKTGNSAMEAPKAVTVAYYRKKQPLTTSISGAIHEHPAFRALYEVQQSLQRRLGLASEE